MDIIVNNFKVSDIFVFVLKIIGYMNKYNRNNIAKLNDQK